MKNPLRQIILAYRDRVAALSLFNGNESDAWFYMEYHPFGLIVTDLVTRIPRPWRNQ